MTDVSVTLRPPCLCPSEGHQHGVFIQSSINLGETLLQTTFECAIIQFVDQLSDVVSTVISESSRTALECALCDVYTK